MAHQKGLFDVIKENPNFLTCRWILHIYCQWKDFKVIQAVATVKLIGVKKIISLARLSRLEMKTAIARRYRTKISLTPKRGYDCAVFRLCGISNFPRFPKNELAGTLKVYF